MTTYFSSTAGRASAIGVIACAAFSHQAGAQIIPVFQHRSLTADTFINNAGDAIQDIDSLLAPDFGPFEQSLNAHVKTGIASASCDVMQDSTIGPCVLNARGSFAGAAEIAVPNVVAYATGFSQFRVTFDLVQPTTYRLIGFAQSDGGQTSVALSTGPIRRWSIG